MTARLTTWKFTTPIRDKNGRRGEYYGEVDAPNASAARQAIAESVQAEGHTCGSVRLTR